MTWEHFNMWLYGLVATLLGGIVYLIRMVFTNNTQLKLLKQQLEIQNASLQRRDDKIDNHLLEIRTDIKALMRQGSENQ